MTRKRFSEVKRYFLVSPQRIIRHKQDLYWYWWWAEVWAFNVGFKTEVSIKGQPINNYVMSLQTIFSKSFDGSWDSYHSIIEHLLATVIALMDTFISSRPWSLRWSTCVLGFASDDSWITWFTSSGKKKECFVKLSKFTKWQLFSLE